MLALLINRAKAADQMSGVVPHFIDGGLSILQYADNTILFMDHNLEHAYNMKIILVRLSIYRVKQSICIRVKSSALMKQRIVKVSTWNCSDAIQALSQFVI